MLLPRLRRVLCMMLMANRSDRRFKTLHFESWPANEAA
jgi:hypothetical protein